MREQLPEAACVWPAGRASACGPPLSFSQRSPGPKLLQGGCLGAAYTLPCSVGHPGRQWPQPPAPGPGSWSAARLPRFSPGGSSPRRPPPFYSGPLLRGLASFTASLLHPGLAAKIKAFHLYFPGERDLHPSFPVSVDHPVYSPFRKAHKCAPFWKDLLHPGKGGRSLAASLPAPRPGLLCLCPASDGSPGLLPGFCTPLKSCVHMLPEQTARLLVGPGRDEALFASS